MSTIFLEVSPRRNIQVPLEGIQRNAVFKSYFDAPVCVGNLSGANIYNTVEVIYTFTFTKEIGFLFPFSRRKFQW